MPQPHPPRRRRNARAFTLIEVMVASMIAVMIIGSLSVTLSQLGRAKTISKERFDTHLRADAALNTVRRDIVSIIRTDDLFFTRFLLYDDAVDSPYGDLARDELVLFNTRLRPVRNIDNFNGEGAEYETQYRIEEDEEGSVLWQRRDALPDEYPLGGGVATPLVQGVIGLSIDAFDGNQWYEEWDSDIRGLPHAVRIMVTASGHRSAEDLYEAPIAHLRTMIPIDRVLIPKDILEDEEEQRIEQEREEAVAGGGDDAGGAGQNGDDPPAPESITIPGGGGNVGGSGPGGGGSGGGGTGGGGGGRDTGTGGPN